PWRWHAGRDSDADAGGLSEHPFPFRAPAGKLPFSPARGRALPGVFPMGARRIRREQRRVDMAESRRTNGMRKMKERARRDSRMLEIIKKGKLPFTPPVVS